MDYNWFRDYDLGMICTSKCDDAFVQCIAACGDSDCFLECNRASVACNEGKNCDVFEFIVSYNINNFSMSM